MSSERPTIDSPHFCLTARYSSNTWLYCALSASASLVAGIVGAVGAGNVTSGVVSEITGGALAILASIDRPLLDPGRRVPCQVHAPAGMYCLMPYGLTAGMALKWFRDEFLQFESREALANGLDPYDAMTQLASTAPAGSNDLIVLPHLEGAYCPEFNPAAKAVFFGATLRHSKAHFIRAILESVAFMLKRNLALLENKAGQFVRLFPDAGPGNQV